MLEHARGLIGDSRAEEAVVRARLERLALEERDLLVEDREVSGRLDVVGDGIGEPWTIV